MVYWSSAILLQWDLTTYLVHPTEVGRTTTQVAISNNIYVSDNTIFYNDRTKRDVPRRDNFEPSLVIWY